MGPNSMDSVTARGQGDSMSARPVFLRGGRGVLLLPESRGPGAGYLSVRVRHVDE